MDLSDDELPSLLNIQNIIQDAKEESMEEIHRKCLDVSRELILEKLVEEDSQKEFSTPSDSVTHQPEITHEVEENTENSETRFFSRPTHLQYFSLKGLTLQSCGYDLDKIVSPLEEIMLALKPEELCDFMSTMGLCEEVTNVNALVHFILKTMSLHSDFELVYSCKKLITDLLATNCVEDIVLESGFIHQILFNCSIDIVNSEASSLFKIQEPISNNISSQCFPIPKHWLGNLRYVLVCLSEILEGCTISEEELCETVVNFLLLLTENESCIREELTDCLIVILDRFSSDTWPIYRSNIATLLGTLAKKDFLKSQWHLIYNMVKGIPLSSTNGVELRRYISVLVLLNLASDTSTDSIEYSDGLFSLSNLTIIILSIYTDDENFQHVIIQFLGLLVDNLKYTTEEFEQLSFQLTNLQKFLEVTSSLLVDIRIINARIQLCKLNTRRRKLLNKSITSFLSYYEENDSSEAKQSDVSEDSFTLLDPFMEEQIHVPAIDHPSSSSNIEQPNKENIHAETNGPLLEQIDHANFLSFCCNNKEIKTFEETKVPAIPHVSSSSSIEKIDPNKENIHADTSEPLFEQTDHANLLSFLCNNNKVDTFVETKVFQTSETSTASNALPSLSSPKTSKTSHTNVSSENLPIMDNLKLSASSLKVFPEPAKEQILIEIEEDEITGEKNIIHSKIATENCIFESIVEIPEENESLKELPISALNIEESPLLNELEPLVLNKPSNDPAIKSCTNEYEVNDMKQILDELDIMWQTQQSGKSCIGEPLTEVTNKDFEPLQNANNKHITKESNNLDFNECNNPVYTTGICETNYCLTENISVMEDVINVAIPSSSKSNNEFNEHFKSNISFPFESHPLISNDLSDNALVLSSCSNNKPSEILDDNFPVQQRPSTSKHLSDNALVQPVCNNNQSPKHPESVDCLAESQTSNPSMPDIILSHNTLEKAPAPHKRQHDTSEKNNLVPEKRRKTSTHINCDDNESVESLDFDVEDVPSLLVKDNHQETYSNYLALREFESAASKNKAQKCKKKIVLVDIGSDSDECIVVDPYNSKVPTIVYLE